MIRNVTTIEVPGLPPFVGTDRLRVLDALSAEWHTCQAEQLSRLMVLEGQPGIGKTRIVQEFFARLAARQPKPSFWPARIEVASERVLAQRGRITPQRFEWPAGAEPSYAWVGVSCQLDEPSGQPARALIPAVQVLEVLHEPLIYRRSWRRRIAAAAVGLAIVAGGLITAVLGLAGIGGPVAALGLVVAVVALKDLPRLAAEVTAVQGERRRVTEDTVIDLAEVLRDTEAEAESRANEFLRWLGERRLPAVVVVDDASWADADTIDLLDALLHRSAPVLVLATVRPDPFENQLTARDGFGRLVRDFHTKTRRIKLQALSDGALTEIVLARAPSTEPRVAAAIAAKAAGNPLVLGAILQQPVIASNLSDGAYHLAPGALASLPSDYRGVFDRYWEQLPDDLRRLVAVATLHGMQVQPDALRAGGSTVCAGDAALLIAQARDPYWWLARVGEDLDRFTDPALLEAATRGLGAVLSSDQLRRARIAMADYVLTRRADDPAWWRRLSADARRVLLRLHVSAAQEGVVPKDQAAAESALELAVLSDTRREAAAAAELADTALRWAAGDQNLIDQGRSIAADRYLAAGRADLAARLTTAQLKYRQSVLGSDHPDTLLTRHHLALAQQAGGRPGQAIPAYRALIADQVRVLGAEHPETLRTRGDLAAALRAAGEFDEAIGAYQALAADQARVLGPDHPDTLRSRSSRADALYDGAHDDPSRVVLSADTYQEVYQDQVRALGATHPDTLRTLSHYVSTLRQARIFDVAIGELDEVLGDQLRVLGPDHPETLETRRELALAFQESGKFNDAIENYQAVLADQEQVLGPDHPDTLLTRDALARAQSMQARSAGPPVRPRILVVSDPTTLEYAPQYLRQDGYKVVTSSTGLDALRTIENQPPDLAIMDMALPDMDALAACRTIQQNPATAGIPIIMLGAVAGEPDVEQARLAGVDCIIARPFRLLTLSNQVASLLGLPAPPNGPPRKLL